MSCCLGSTYRWVYRRKTNVWVLMVDMRLIGFKVSEPEPGTYQVMKGSKVITTASSLASAKRVVEGRAGVILT